MAKLRAAECREFIDAVVEKAGAMGVPVSLAMTAEDVRHLERGAHVRRSGRRDYLQIEAVQREVEEVLPEGEVASLDRDELIQHPAQILGGDPAQRAVEREVEELVEDQSPG